MVSGPPLDFQIHECYAKVVRAVGESQVLSNMENPDNLPNQIPPRRRSKVTEEIWENLTGGIRYELWNLKRGNL